MAEIVSPQRAATKENVQRKQARTDGERDDSENEESEEESVEDDADDVPYNPKNLPLGWDGKVVDDKKNEFIKKVIFLLKFTANTLLVIQIAWFKYKLQLRNLW